jgi:hypothetical protein
MIQRLARIGADGIGDGGDCGVALAFEIEGDAALVQGFGAGGMGGGAALLAVHAILILKGRRV